MGLSLSFIASQGPDPLESLGLSADGKTLRAEPLPPPARFVAFELGGWRVVMSDDHRFASRERVSAAAQGGVAIGVYMEEHVMVSGAFGAKDGQLTWSVQHDPEHGLEHLDVWADPLADRIFRPIPRILCPRQTGDETPHPPGPGKGQADPTGQRPCIQVSFTRRLPDRRHIRRREDRFSSLSPQGPGHDVY